MAGAVPGDSAGVRPPWPRWGRPGPTHLSCTFGLALALLIRRGMNTPRFFVAALTCLLLAPACTIDVDVDREVDSRVRLELELQGECEGSGELTTDQGKSEYTKTLADDGLTCVIEVRWNGTLVDMAELRDDIGEEVDVDDVTIESVAMSLEAAVIADAQGKGMTPPLVPYFAAQVESDGERLLSIERDGVARLIAEPFDLTVSPRFTGTVDRALHQGTTVRGTAVATLHLRTEDLAPLQGREDPAAIQMELVTTVGATAKVHPLRR